MLDLKSEFLNCLADIRANSRAANGGPLNGPIRTIEPDTSNFQDRPASVPAAQTPNLELKFLERRVVSNPAALFYNGKGDHILALPALRALTALFPGQITLICRHRAHEVFFSELHLRRVVEAEFWQEGDCGHHFDARQ